jgi:hypothetical protein
MWCGNHVRLTYKYGFKLIILISCLTMWIRRHSREAFICFTRQVAQEMLSGLPRLSGRPVGINQNYITSSSVD